MTTIFEHLCSGNLHSALQHNDHTTLTPYLPYLCKVLQVIQGPLRIRIIQVLQRSPLSTTLCQLLDNDFSQVLSDAVKEQQLRKKACTRREDSMLFRDTLNTIDTVFAGRDIDAKVRVIAAEVIYLQSQYSQGPVTSELLSYTEYQDLISAVLCVLCYRIPEVFDMRDILVMLVHLPHAKHYIDSLVVNSPERYVEVLHTLIELFLEGKPGNFEQKIISHIRDISSLVSDPRQLVTLDTISNTRKRIMLHSLLTSNQTECSSPDRIILPLFSEKDTAHVIDFVKNESKVFEKLVRFSDLRGRLIGLVASVTCDGEASGHNDTTANMDKTKDEDTFYCSFLDDTIREDLVQATTDTTSGTTTTTTKVLTLQQVIRANQLLILYLNIVNTCRLSLQHQECRELVGLISHKPCSGEEGDLFIRLSLSLYMSCNSLNCNVEVGDMIRRWLTELLAYSYEGGGKGELILLTGMHLYSGNYERIGPILSQTTGLSISVSAGHAATVQTLWSQIQSEEQIVAQLANVPVTPALSSLVPGYLPIHCITQLITSRLPSCPPNLFSWLPQQLRQTAEPVHPVLCELISGCVSYLMSVRGRTMSGIDEEVLASLLSPSNTMSCRVLSFYYLLLYRKALTDLKLKSDVQRGSLPLPAEYAVALLGDDSAKTLLLHTRNNRKNYASIYPTFLKLLVSQFPFLCDPQELLAEEEANAHISKLGKNSDNFSVTQYLQNILQALECKQECKSFYMISKMLKRHHEYIPSELIAQCIPHVIKHGFRVQGCFIKLWEKSAALNPQQTWLNTAQTLVDYKLSEDELWVNPLLLFQVSSRVTNTPAGIRILLHMLKGYLSLCNARLADVDPPSMRKFKEHEDNKTLYVTLQNSAIVQVLLELTDRAAPQNGVVTSHHTCDVTTHVTAIEADHGYENSALVYNFLHDFFIKNDGLSKLVCWQTFRFSQIEGVVNGVPSLHVACKFTTVLLQQSSLQKQLFSVCLLSHLAVQYPIQQTLAACNEMLQWAIAQTGQMSTVWTVLSLQSFLRVAAAFPPLVDPITRLLLHQKKLLSNFNIGSIKHKMKMFSDIEDGCFNPQRMIDDTVEQLMSDILVRMRGT